MHYKNDNIIKLKQTYQTSAFFSRSLQYPKDTVTIIHEQ